MKRALTLTLLLALTSASAMDAYRLNTEQTRVEFDVERFGLHWVGAHFRDFRGDFVFDRGGTDSRVDVTVQTGSIDCEDSRFNPQLRSPEWLDVQRFPLMLYRSRSIRFEGEDRAEARGELTLHGLTHPVVLEVSQLQCTNAADGDQSCRFVARARVKRSDYGLPHGFWTGGDQVDITITGAGSQVHAAPAPAP
jgi:polyisoprenoid-binding protein YceI